MASDNQCFMHELQTKRLSVEPPKKFSKPSKTELMFEGFKPDLEGLSSDLEGFISVLEGFNAMSADISFMSLAFIAMFNNMELMFEGFKRMFEDIATEIEDTAPVFEGLKIELEDIKGMSEGIIHYLLTIQVNAVNKIRSMSKVAYDNGSEKISQFLRGFFIVIQLIKCGVNGLPLIK